MNNAETESNEVPQVGWYPISACMQITLEDWILIFVVVKVHWRLLNSGEVCLHSHLRKIFPWRTQCRENSKTGDTQMVVGWTV